MGGRSELTGQRVEGAGGGKAPGAGRGTFLPCMWDTEEYGVAWRDKEGTPLEERQDSREPGLGDVFSLSDF